MNRYMDLNNAYGQYRWYGLGNSLGPTAGQAEAMSNTLMVFGGIVLIGLFIWGMKQ